MHDRSATRTASHSIAPMRMRLRDVFQVRVSGAERHRILSGLRGASADVDTQRRDRHGASSRHSAGQNQRPRAQRGARKIPTPLRVVWQAGLHGGPPDRPHHPTRLYEARLQEYSRPPRESRADVRGMQRSSAQDQARYLGLEPASVRCGELCGWNESR